VTYPRASISLILRSDTNSPTVMAGLRDAVRDVNGTQPPFGMQTMGQVLGESLALRRFLMLLIGIFAFIALTFGLAGVYRVIAYVLGQRRQELAIRVALGATQSEIVWLVATRGLLLASVGVALGLAASIALSRVLAGTLFGISPLDPLTYVVAPALLFVVVAAASSLPALSAGRVQSVAALRGE
jgi:putative ABC transport system permease protein